MIEVSPYHPEIDAIWHAISSTGARSIAVVSAEPGEGTTLIATALARRAGLSANADRPTAGGRAAPVNNVALLVDLDIERPAVNRVLGLRPQPGELVRLDAMGIAVLGDIGNEAVEAWRERTELGAQLASWRATWSVVVLNTSPLLGSESDSIPGATAAAAADVCVLVTLAGRTSGNRIREAREKLAATGANLIGSILNDRDSPSLLAELDRETYRVGKFFPKAMANLRGWMRRSPVLNARI